MKHGAVKLLLTLFVIVFAIFFGIEVVSRGVERVHGPLDGNGTTALQPQTAYYPPAGTVTQPVSGIWNGQGQGQATPQATGTWLPGPANGQTGAGQNADSIPSAPERKVEIEVRKSFVNRLFNRTGDALRRLAKLIIDAIVSTLDAITG